MNGFIGRVRKRGGDRPIGSPAGDHPAGKGARAGGLPASGSTGTGGGGA